MSIHKRKYKSGKTVWSYFFDAPGSTWENREQISASGFSTKKQATDAEAKRRIETQKEHESKGVTAPLPDSLTGMLEAFFKEHGESNLEAKTLERYRQDAAYLHKDLLAMPVTQVTPLHLRREWNRLLARRWTPSTNKGCTSAIG